MLKRWIPVLGWAPSYRRADLQPDLAAGATVAAMLVPQAMAYALLAGLPPEVGLYAATLPLLAYAFLGTSRQLAVGPVAIVSLLAASALGSLFEQGTAGYIEAAALLALLVGAVSIVFGVLRLGFLTNLLSHPVLVGYTAAAAIIIGTSQIKHVLGVSIDRTEHWHETVGELVGALGDVSWWTIAIGAASIALLVILKRLYPRVPGALVVVVLATVGVSVFGLADKGVSTVGEIPNDLPGFSVPNFDGGLIGDLLPMAVIITFVGFMESIAVAKVYGRRNRYEVDANQELVALGASNVTSGFIGGYPVTGGFSRTAVNASAGARTPLASVITAGLVLVTVVVLTPLFKNLPQAALAAIIIVAVIGLIDVPEMRHIARVKRSDFLTLAIAFVATLAAGVEWGILVAVVASLIVTFVRIARPHSAELGRLPGTDVYRNVERFPEAQTIPGVAILRIDVSLNFANAAFLKRRVAKLVESNPDVHTVVFDAGGVNDMDASGEQALAEVIEEYDPRGVLVHLASVKGPVRDVMIRAGLWERLAGRIHATVPAAVAACTAPEVPPEPADNGHGRMEDLSLAGVDERG